jgi:zinc transport system substrate-binding protein
MAIARVHTALRFFAAVVVVPVVCVVLFLTLFVGCSRAPSTTPVGRPSGVLHVTATIPPIQGIIEPLLQGSGLQYELNVLTPPGVSEHGFEIPPDKLVALDRADVVVMVGFGMEPQVEKYLAQHERQSRRVVVLSEVVKDPLQDDDDDHGDGHHQHGSDPHIWLDPVMVKSMLPLCAKAVKEASELDAAAAARVDQSQSRLSDRVDQVDAAYRTTLSIAIRRTIIVAHDAYGYLARRYNLDVVAISGLNAGEPQPGDIKKAADTVREKGLTTIFTEPQLNPAAAERLAQATGAKVAILDPLGAGDWFSLMNKNLQVLKDALGQNIPEAKH